MTGSEGRPHPVTFYSVRRWVGNRKTKKLLARLTVLEYADCRVDDASEQTNKAKIGCQRMTRRDVPLITPLLLITSPRLKHTMKCASLPSRLQDTQTVAQMTSDAIILGFRRSLRSDLTSRVKFLRATVCPEHLRLPDDMIVMGLSRTTAAVVKKSQSSFWISASFTESTIDMRYDLVEDYDCCEWPFLSPTLRLGGAGCC